MPFKLAHGAAFTIHLISRQRGPSAVRQPVSEAIVSDKLLQMTVKGGKN